MIVLRLCFCLGVICPNPAGVELKPVGALAAGGSAAFFHWFAEARCCEAVTGCGRPAGGAGALASESG